jgi:hypothetical protein
MTEEGKALTYRRWHQEMELLLVSLGLHGTSEPQLIKHFKDVHPDEIKAYLELLLKEDKAQKFLYSRKNYWRATVNILDEAYRK